MNILRKRLGFGSSNSYIKSEVIFERENKKIQNNFTNKTNDANILRKYNYFLRYSHQFLIPKLDEKASLLNHENI